MEEDDSSKLSPALYLNQSVSNGNAAEVRSELGQDQTLKIGQEEDAEARVSTADAEEAEPPPSGDGVAKAPHAPEDGVARVSQLDIAGNGEDKELPSRTGHSRASSSPSPDMASPARNNNRATSPSERESSPPAKQVEESPAKQVSSPASRSKRTERSKSPSSPPAKQVSSPASRSKRTERSKSPSPKRRRSSAGGLQSSSRSPEGRRRSASRSPEARHVRRKEDGKRRHDRSKSPAGRPHRREKSRSWSPYERERERERERRTRHSPRRRSSPSRYPSRGDRSPRKRPWSPPRNRNTGVGKPGNHLFVAGFSFATTERDLEKKFGRYGRVSDVRIIRDRRSGDSRGFGFLSLERDDEADDAIRGLDQTEWNGRIVLVEKAKTN